MLLLFVCVCLYSTLIIILETGCSGWLEYPPVCSFTDIEGLSLFSPFIACFGCFLCPEGHYAVDGTLESKT